MLSTKFLLSESKNIVVHNEPRETQLQLSPVSPQTVPVDKGCASPISAAAAVNGTGVA